MDVLKLLFPLLFIAFVLSQITRIEFGQSAFTLMDIAAGVTFFTWLLFGTKTKYRLKVPILAFSSIALLSLILNFTKYSSNELLVSFLYFLRWVSYAGLYFVVKDAVKFKPALTKYLIGAGFFIVLIGYLQFFLYPDLKNLYYAGWDEHIYRMFSSFLDPNFAGAFFVLYFILLIPFFEKSLKDKNKRNVWTYGFLGVLTLIAVFLTYSRSAILMLGISSLTYSIIRRDIKLVLGVIGAILIAFVILSPKFYIENTNLLRTASTESRLTSYSEAIQIASQSPLFGVGFNSYRYAREKLGFEDRSLYGPSHAGAGTDNSFLFVLSTTGILGLSSFIYLLISIIKQARKRIGKNLFASVVLVSVIGLIVNSLFINSLFYPSIMLWLFVILGLMESTEP